MNITVDISMYPLADDYKPAIKAFIRRLREFEGLALVTNQLSTQLRGEFEAVTSAVNACMHEAMQAPHTVVLVVKYLNIDADINRVPSLAPDD